MDGRNLLSWNVHIHLSACKLSFNSAFYRFTISCVYCSAIAFSLPLKTSEELRLISLNFSSHIRTLLNIFWSNYMCNNHERICYYIQPFFFFESEVFFSRTVLFLKMYTVAPILYLFCTEFYQFCRKARVGLDFICGINTSQKFCTN